MKGTVFEVKHFAVHDGDGIRTTLFLKGCPLSCIWCHNPEGLSFKSELALYSHKCTKCGECVKACEKHAHIIDKNGVHILDRNLCITCGKCVESCFNGALKLFGKEVEADDILPELLEDKDFFESSGGGVTLSGGECLMQADFCKELLQKLKENGINTAVDTSGFVSKENIDKVLPYTDTFLYDLKAFNEKTHIECTGQSNKIILENLRYILSLSKRVEIRVPFVPEKNGKDMEDIAKFLSSFDNSPPVRILPYHNYSSSKYLAVGISDAFFTDMPTEEEIKSVKEKFKYYGLTVKE